MKSKLYCMGVSCDTGGSVFERMFNENSPLMQPTQASKSQTKSHTPNPVHVCQLSFNRSDLTHD